MKRDWGCVELRFVVERDRPPVSTHDFARKIENQEREIGRELDCKEGHREEDTNARCTGVPGSLRTMVRVPPSKCARVRPSPPKTTLPSRITVGNGVFLFLRSSVIRKRDLVRRRAFCPRMRTGASRMRTNNDYGLSTGYIHDLLGGCAIPDSNIG